MIRLVIAICFIAAVAGCGTNDSSVLGPAQGQTVATHSGAYVTFVEIEGVMVKALVVDDRDAPNGVKVIMVLDYPCGFVGPLPAGHGRDCTDTDTPSDEPHDARYIGDPTADD